MRLAVIPARSGSKRVPLKNVRDFCGKPMIAWAIEAAINSNLFDEIIVSTDAEGIADIATNWGAKAPFIRPAHLSDDLAGTVPVICHATQWAMAHDLNPDYVCCIYPCAPLIEVGDLTAAFDLMVSRGVDFVYPVTEYAHPIQRAMLLTQSGAMKFLQPEFEVRRTQDLDKTYHDAGQFYWGTSSAWLANKKMHTAGLGMPIPNWRVVDIDSSDDWFRAELIFKALRAK